MRTIKKMSLNSLINIIMFLYILSLYLLTYREGLNNISNVLAALLIVTIWMNFLLRKKRLVFNNFLFIYLLFCIIGLMSFFVAFDKNTVITKVKTLILIFIAMLSLINYIDTYEKLRKFISSFIYSGFIASLYILITSDFSNLTRFGSRLGNVNAIGMIIGISVTFCFYIFLEEGRYRYLLLMSTMIPTILLTGSRKSLLFIFINFIIILYLRNRTSITKKIKFFFVGGIILFITLYLIFSVPLFYKIIGYRIENVFSFLSGSKVNEGSVYERSYMIKVGLDLFKERPLSGYGIDNYRFYFNNVLGGRETYSHNNFIELMVGTGIFGVLVYYLTHIIVLKKLFKVSKYSKDKTVCYTFIAIIISYTFLSMVLIYYYGKHFSLLLAVGSIISRVIYNNDKKEVI